MFLKVGDYVTLGPAKHLVEDKEGSLGAPKEDLQKQRVGFVTGVVGSCVNVRHGDITSTYDPLSLRKVSVKADENDGEIKGWENFGAGKKVQVYLSSQKKTFEYTPDQLEIVAVDPRILSGGARTRRRRCGWRRTRRRRGGAMTQKQMALNRLAAQGLLSRTPTVRQLALEKLGAIPSGPLRRRNTRRRR